MVLDRQQGSHRLQQTEYNKSERALMCSNGAMFQREKTLVMVPLEV